MTAIEAAARVIAGFWPRACPETGRGDAAPTSPDGWEGCRELFIFRDLEARDAWRRVGGADENFNTMIHLLAGPDDLTVVVDEPVGEIAEILAAIRRQVEA